LFKFHKDEDRYYLYCSHCGDKSAMFVEKEDCKSDDYEDGDFCWDCHNCGNVNID